ncbi:DUF262 domain-containing protein [Planosporangium thailandense]|uniref:DUF262 domain-containing protein n=2 Tax=Planosporangium thailandense TaxID=765197 RepID=A0ABX0Y0A5_9ACTN|nr:DUF262 domain-containing protein [Planosporangium thailandense]NJC70865.1 DUF262 domain-containing protein [Planosporangium thailandense]
MNVSALASSGALDLSPRFQRRNRWERDRQSRLIESFILNVPVPPVYLAEERRGKFSVIDGKQRLTAIAKFLNNEIRLTSLVFLPDLDGLSFEELSPALQSTLNMRPLRAVTVMRQTPEWMKYEVFIRLNTGGQPLNAQEVRNVAFAGPLNDMIIELANDKFLRQQLKIRSSASPAYAAMLDVEYVLRFLALSSNWQSFSGSLRSTLDDFMLKNYEALPRDVERYGERFTRAISACRDIWGSLAFKRYDSGYWRDQMIGGVYDAQMVACALVSDDTLEIVKRRKKRATDAMVDLFGDPDFDAAVRIGTNTPSRVRLRIEFVRDLLTVVAAE